MGEKMKRVSAAAGVVGLCALSILGIQFSALAPAWANNITAASPAQNAVISTTPNVVSITTDEPLVQEGTSLQVIDPTGNEVDDHSLTVSGSTAVIGMQNLSASGVYKVLYNLYFQNSSPLIGNYSFTFNSPGSITSGGSSDTSTSGSNSTGGSSSSGSNSSSNNSGSTSNSSSQSNTTNPAPISSSSGGNTFIYLLMLSALIVGLGLLWYAYVLMERSRRNQSRAAARRTTTKK